jgi:hypothetical protein
MQRTRSVIARVAVALLLLPVQVAYAQPLVAAAQGTIRHADARHLTGARTDVISPQLTMAPNVVVVSAPTVSADLLSVSSDGSTFVFKSATGTLSHLAPGKVMLLQGYTAGVVVSVSRSGSRLTVVTQPAALTNIFQNADINFSQPIDFSNAFGALSPGTPISSDLAQPAGTRRPDVTVRPAGDKVPPVGLYYFGRGPGDFSYSVFASPSLSRLNWEIQTCVGAAVVIKTTSCNGGSSRTGLSIAATISGYIAKANLSGNFDIANGKNVRSSFSFLSVGGVTVTYQILDPNKGTYKLPVLRFPLSFNIPFVVAGIPMQLKISFAVLINVAMSSKNDTIHGGTTLTYNANESATESGTGDSAPQSLPKIVGSFLTSKPTITLGSAAIEIAAQMKVGFGPGIAVANILGYGDVIVALGQRTGSLVAGLPCSAFYLTVSGHAYMESQIAIWRITSKPVDLFSKSYSDPKAQC